MLPEAVERLLEQLGDKSAVFIPSLYGGIFQYENFFLGRGEILSFSIDFIYWEDNEEQKKKSKVFLYLMREPNWKSNKENAICRNLSNVFFGQVVKEAYFISSYYEGTFLEKSL